jgi:hypothetical protein
LDEEDLRLIGPSKGNGKAEAEISAKPPWEALKRIHELKKSRPISPASSPAAFSLAALDVEDLRLMGPSKGNGKAEAEISAKPPSFREALKHIHELKQSRPISPAALDVEDLRLIGPSKGNGMAEAEISAEPPWEALKRIHELKKSRPISPASSPAALGEEGLGLMGPSKGNGKAEAEISAKPPSFREALKHIHELK